MDRSVVKPFRATYYNPKLIKDHSRVICPPYDVISPKQLLMLRKSSPYNFSKVLIADNGNYKKTSLTLRCWAKNKILVEDSLQSLYLYEQKFKVGKKNLIRFGILSLLKMDNGDIFPHEHTLKAPKEDRKRIIRAVQANLSPVFVIAISRLEALHSIYKGCCAKTPFFKFKDYEGNLNRVWKISDKKQIAKLAKAVSNSKIVIADGHHRFEISYDYFKKNRNKFKDLNYILAYITDCQKGLNILPTHRIVKIKDGPQVFLDKLKPYFSLTKVKLSLLERKLNNSSKFSFGIYRDSKAYFAELKDQKTLNRIPDKSYKRLDTYVFHQLVLPLLEKEGGIEYTHSVDEAKKLAGKEKTAFILKAVDLDSVFKISSKGFRLPQKSTYFYPKVISGIVIRRFEKRYTVHGKR
jgi:uncharacterized protein (DUF1015 family)